MSATANPYFDAQRKAFESLNKIQWTCVISEGLQVAMGAAMLVSIFLSGPRGDRPSFLFEGERISFSLSVLYLVSTIFSHTVVYSIASGLDDAFSKSVGLRMRPGLMKWLGVHTVIAGISVPVYFSSLPLVARIIPATTAFFVGALLALHVRRIFRGARSYLEQYLSHAMRTVDPS